MEVYDWLNLAILSRFMKRRRHCRSNPNKIGFASRGIATQYPCAQLPPPDHFSPDPGLSFPFAAEPGGTQAIRAVSEPAGGMSGEHGPLQHGGACCARVVHRAKWSGVGKGGGRKRESNERVAARAPLKRTRTSKARKHTQPRTDAGGHRPAPVSRFPDQRPLPLFGQAAQQRLNTLPEAWF